MGLLPGMPDNENLIAQPNKNDFKRDRIDGAIRRKRKRQFFWIGGVLVFVALIIFAGVQYSKWSTRNLPGISIPDLGREHVGLGHIHIYNSNPPTSGWHFGQPADWGVYKQELPDETLIHNLEHGGIWISYKPDIPDDIKKKLEDFYEKYGRKTIVTPRLKNDADIALVAWGRLDTFSVSEYSDERVEKFIKAFRNKGPEFVP